MNDVDQAKYRLRVTMAREAEGKLRTLLSFSRGYRECLEDLLYRTNPDDSHLTDAERQLLAEAAYEIGGAHDMLGQAAEALDALKNLHDLVFQYGSGHGT